jgi:hypothetical protein
MIQSFTLNHGLGDKKNSFHNNLIKTETKSNFQLSQQNATLPIRRGVLPILLPVFDFLAEQRQLLQKLFRIIQRGCTVNYSFGAVCVGFLLQKEKPFKISSEIFSRHPTLM